MKIFHPQYLIRFDDICPTMNWEMWSRIEAVLIDLDIKPIVAVIPDNKDKAFFLNDPVEDFWLRVKRWEKHGWSIGLHGCHHQYTTNDAGLLSLTRQSEFAGVDPARQFSSLSMALETFRHNRISPDVWIAPSHSFDLQTLKALKQLGVTTISDGFSFYPFRQYGMLWIPQQIWKFRFFPFGLWTVCLHHNHWSEDDFEKFVININKFKKYITSFEIVKNSYVIHDRDFLDIIFHNIFSVLRKSRNIMKASL